MKSKMLAKELLAVLAIASLVFLVGCGGTTGQSINQPPGGVTVSPASATVQTGGVQQFTATVSPSGANQAVTWSLSETGCAGASCGTIDATGKYTAPASVPNPPTVTVRATSVVNAAAAAFAAVNITNPIPAITTISPNSAESGGAAFTLTVNGSNFLTGSSVRWNGSDRPTAFISASQVSAQIPASDIAVAGTAAITVFNPAPGGGASNSLTFTITGPTITTISPNGADTGGAAFTLTVNGRNFVTGSVVRWNGSDRPTAFISASQVSAQIPASDIAVAGTAAITVFNPAPGGGASNSLTFTITGPTITTISPNRADTGGAAFTLTVNGTNFVSAAQLTAAIPVAAITTARIAAVTVTNPAPSGGASNPVNFTIGRFLPRFAYAANGDSNDVSMYTINATTGALTAMAPGTIAAGRFPQAVAVDPSGRFAYVATLEFDAVSMYTINATTGALTSIGTTVTGGGSANSVAVDPSGRFAYVASADNDFGFSSLVSMFTINATTGVLTSIGAIDAGITPASVAVDPSGRFAYAASNALSDGEIGNVFMYIINTTTGALTSIGTIAAGSNPLSVAVDTSGRFAYVANAELF